MSKYIAFDLSRAGYIQSLIGTTDEGPTEGEVLKCRESIKKMPENMFGGRKFVGTELYSTFLGEDRPLVFYLDQKAKPSNDQR